MNTMKIGTFPGRLEEYAVENGTTVRQALELAGIEVTDEQEVKMDGTPVTMDDTASGNMLLVTKRLKGAR